MKFLSSDEDEYLCLLNFMLILWCEVMIEARFTTIRRSILKKKEKERETKRFCIFAHFKSEMILSGKLIDFSFCLYLKDQQHRKKANL